MSRQVSSGLLYLKSNKYNNQQRHWFLGYSFPVLECYEIFWLPCHFSVLEIHKFHKFVLQAWKIFLFCHIISGPGMLYNFVISFSRLGIPWNMESQGKWSTIFCLIKEWEILHWFIVWGYLKANYWSMVLKKFKNFLEKVLEVKQCELWQSIIFYGV